jgi:glycosyltransferase involved in cell wall biosynthesis
MLRNDLRGRGLARAAQFTWERTARQTLAVYQTVAQSPKPRA